MDDINTLSSTSATADRIPPKRCLSSTDFTFFTSAATSFRPRPYSPRTISATVQFNHTNKHVARPIDNHSMAPVGMDPQPTDPNVIFIHPPFTTFPRSELYPDGLSYQAMAENSEWFLDADDFVSQYNTNPIAIPYPPHLEPPRGWCPAKKKDLKDRGADGWPEGEEPRLRCTFCRRTYAGVNAKSMWRRHVFEKHKIAMSNRREGNDRPRGRGSNKENRLSSKTHHPPHDKLVALTVNPQTDFSNTLHKSKFRSVGSMEQMPASRPKDKHQPLAPSPLAQTGGSPPPGERKTSHPLARSHVPLISPPLTPHPDLPNTRSESTSQSRPPSSPASALPPIPPSPYDPLLTPSFRHSPPRLPSDQPWRFPSPSHPLHSRARELSLSMLLRECNSPLGKGSLTTANESPRSIISPVVSPRVFSSTSRPGIFDFGTPVNLEKLSRSTPGISFTKGRLPEQKARYLIQESPLQHTAKANLNSRRRPISEEWPLVSTGVNMGVLASPDPFASPWRRVMGRPDALSSPAAVSGAESPILRNATLSSNMGLGIGLLEPFVPEAPTTGSNSPRKILCTTQEEDDEAEVTSFLEFGTTNGTMGRHSEATICTTPPLKRRKIAPPE